MKIKYIIPVVAMLTVPSVAEAYDWSVNARVTLIEGTYAPWNLPFQINRDAGNCKAGNMLFWHPKGSDAVAQAQSYQSILAILLTAQAAGKSVQLFGNNSDCSVDFIYITSP